MMKKRPVAVFDVDGTVFRASLLIEIVDAFIAAGIFPASVRRLYAREQQLWLDRKGSYEDYILKVVAVFRSKLKGVHYSDFEAIAEGVTLGKRDRVYRYTRDLIKELKRKGYYLLAISHSPKLILEPFCKSLGFNKVYGFMYEIGPGNRFTGEVEELHLIGNKALILKRALEKEHITLEKSVGVGDTEGDIGFLEMVARPICFNPNERLYKYAKRMDWEVVVERKDVIYRIDSKLKTKN